MKTKLISISISPEEAAVIIQGVTSLPLAMKDPLHAAALSVYGKIKSAAKDQADAEKKEEVEGHVHDGPGPEGHVHEAPGKE